LIIHAAGVVEEDHYIRLDIVSENIAIISVGETNVYEWDIPKKYHKENLSDCYDLLHHASYLPTGP
jgi:hypothetical protein